MVNITQRLKANATSNIKRGYKKLSDGLSWKAVFSAAMQLRDKHSYKDFHLILHLKQLHYIQNKFYGQTHNISCVDSQGAQKLFVAVGATPLVSQSICLMDILQLCPYIHQFPIQPIINQVINRNNSFTALNTYSSF